MNKLGKLHSSIDIIPLQGTSEIIGKTNKNVTVDNQIPRDPRVPRDPLIISRVQMYLFENEHQVYIDVNDMADSLQRRYRDYRTKKRGAFRSMVRRAYDEIKECYSKKSDSPSWNYDDEDEEEDDDDEVEVEFDPRNDTQGKQASKKLKKSVEGRNGNSSDKELIDISSDDEHDDKYSTDSVKKRRESDQSSKSAIRSCTSISTTAGTPRTSSMQCNKDTTTESTGIESPPTPQDDLPTKKRARERSSEGSNLGSSKKRKTLLTIMPKATGNVATTSRSNGSGVGISRGIESRVKFADLGGNRKILETVCRLLVHMKHPEIFRQLGISPPRGFLLHGPPGCGKTLMAHAIAGELGVPLLKVAAPELIAGISGESEARIRELFDQAVALAPSVLFLDEVDAVAAHRSTAQREMERRIVAQLLSCLDDLGSRENGETVLVLGATNRPDALDPALRRAGRFDREISLGIPDKDARTSILAVHAKTLKFGDDVDLSSIASLTPGFVGADLVALLREAAMARVNRALELPKSTVKEAASISARKDAAKPVESRISDELAPKIVPLENGMHADEAEKLSEIPKSVENEAVASSAISAASSSDAPVILEAFVPEKPQQHEKPQEIRCPLPKESPQQIPPAEIASAEKKSSTELEGLLRWLRGGSPISADELSKLRVERIDFESALRVVQPSAKREGFATVPDVTWDQIGSLRDVREELQMAILAPVRHPERFAAFGLDTPTGVMLCGPPGCGKTLLAKAIANEAGINFISVKGPELLNMYVGESEKAVRQCFIRARNSAPCVIFFDELDALCPRRSEGDNSSTSRIVNQMLTEMDGVEGRTGVYLMAASNRPDIIDPAVLRPGRLDKVLYVGLPTPTERVDILRALTKNGTRPKFASEVDLEAIGKRLTCNGYSGADLAALVREAATEALRESMDDENDASDVPQILNRHFDVAFAKVRPSVHESDVKYYEKLRKTYSTNAKKSSEVVPMDTPVETPLGTPINPTIDAPIDAPMIDATMEAMET